MALCAHSGDLSKVQWPAALEELNLDICEQITAPPGCPKDSDGDLYYASGCGEEPPPGPGTRRTTRADTGGAEAGAVSGDQRRTRAQRQGIAWDDLRAATRLGATITTSTKPCVPGGRASGVEGRRRYGGGGGRVPFPQKGHVLAPDKRGALLAARPEALAAGDPRRDPVLFSFSSFSSFHGTLLGIGDAKPGSWVWTSFRVATTNEYRRVPVALFTSDGRCWVLPRAEA